jgi:outer membrane protein assembly factor BamB
MRIVLIFLLLCSILSASPNPGDARADSAPPVAQWKFHTAGAIVASPVTDDGLLFVGSADSVLYAVEIASGAARWSYKTRGPIKSAVAVDGDHVLLVGGDGSVYSFDKQSGAVRWTFKTEGERLCKTYSYADYYCSSPVVRDSVVYFGSGDGYVYAVTSDRGQLVWRFKTGDVVHATPAVDGGKVFVGSFDGFLYALDRRSGTLAWKFKSVGHRFFPMGEMQGTPVLGNGLVYVGSRDYNLYALDTAKGYCHWNRQFPKGWAMALTARDTVLYVGTSDDDLLLALDGRTGKELWSTDVQFNIFGSPNVEGPTICVGTLLGRALGVDRRSGAISWAFNTDGYNKHRADYFASESHIVKDEFYAIVQSPEGYIDALHALGAVFSTPALSGDLLMFTSTDGTVYCLKR